jgi:hypothetical protein
MTVGRVLTLPPNRPEARSRDDFGGISNAGPFHAPSGAARYLRRATDGRRASIERIQHSAVCQTVTGAGFGSVFCHVAPGALPPFCRTRNLFLPYNSPNEVPEVPMLQITCDHPLSAIEPALRRAAARRQASFLHAMHVGQHLPEPHPGEDACVYVLCAAELYSGLLAADIRLAAFLPWRIAAHTRAGKLTLTAMSPLDACRLLDRLDLAPLAAPLEDLLRSLMEDAAQNAAASARPGTAARQAGLGATEDQMNARGAIPQRIDCRGTKVEDLGGTGEHDAQGG